MFSATSTIRKAEDSVPQSSHPVARGRPKLAIITEIIAPYRIPIFNALAKRRGLDLHVVFLSENDPALRSWRVYKEEIEFQYNVLPSWRQRIGQHNILINRAVARTLSAIAPDVVLCGGYNYPASWQAAYWAKRHNVPFLLWSESTALDNRRASVEIEFLKKRFLDMCDAFVVPGASAAGYLRALRASPRIFQAPNAVNTDFFSKRAADIRQGKLRPQIGGLLPSRFFLFVGRIVGAKGIFELLAAYERMHSEIRREVGLVLAGDGEDRPEAMVRASAIAPGDIRFTGFMHREELAELYTLAEALILPTHSDTWGMVVNEAMACGLPVIVTHVAGCASDLVEDGWNGILIRPHDPSELAAAMMSVAGASDARSQMAARGLKRIKAYSPAAWAEGVARAVASVCPERI